MKLIIKNFTPVTKYTQNLIEAKNSIIRIYNLLEEYVQLYPYTSEKLASNLSAVFFQSLLDLIKELDEYVDEEIQNLNIQNFSLTLFNKAIENTKDKKSIMQKLETIAENLAF